MSYDITVWSSNAKAWSCVYLCHYEDNLTSGPWNETQFLFGQNTAIQKTVSIGFPKDNLWIKKKQACCENLVRTAGALGFFSSSVERTSRNLGWWPGPTRARTHPLSFVSWPSFLTIRIQMFITAMHYPKPDQCIITILSIGIDGKNKIPTP